MRKALCLYLSLVLFGSTLAGPSEYIQFLNNAGTVQKSYEHICNTKISGTESINKSYRGICNVVKSSELCTDIKKEEQLKCKDVEENNIDVLSFSFLKHCGLGLWDSFTELIEFLYEAVVGVAKYIFVKEDRDKVNEFTSEAMKSMKNYIAIELAKEKDKGQSTAEAALAVAGDLTRMMFKKLGSMIQENYVNLGCYNQQARQKRICKIVGDFVIPPVILIGAVFKGAKAIKVIKKAKADKSDLTLQSQIALEKQLNSLPDEVSKNGELLDEAVFLTGIKQIESPDLNQSGARSPPSRDELSKASDEAYDRFNEKLLDRYPQYGSIVKDPKAYFEHIEDLFEKQKKITPDNPYKFDFSEYGMPVVKDMERDLVSKIEEIKAKLNSTTNPKKRAEYEANLEHLKMLQDEVATHLKAGKINYEDSYILGHFYSRAIGLFDTEPMGVVDKAFLELDRRFQGYKPLSAKEELDSYKKGDFILFQKESSVDGFQDAHHMFDKASFNKDKLEMVFIPSTEHLGADIFSRLVPHDIYFMGISNKLMEADGFTRAGGDFWVHDLRHSSAIFHKKKVYEEATNITKVQKDELQKRADLWKEELNKEIMEIEDKETRSAIRLFMFNFHHDRGYPMLPSSYKQFDKVDSVPYWLHFMLTVSGQPRTFKNAHEKYPKGYEWLKKFWKKREAQENDIINNKKVTELGNKAINYKEGKQVLQGSSGIQVDGNLSKIHKGEKGDVIYINTDGPTSLTYFNNPLKGQGVQQHPSGFGSPVGRLNGSKKKIEDFSETDLAKYKIKEGQEITMTYSSGVTVTGKLSNIKKQNGKIVLMSFESAEVKGPKGETLFGKKWGTYDMAIMDELVGKVE